MREKTKWRKMEQESEIIGVRIRINPDNCPPLNVGSSLSHIYGCSKMLYFHIIYSCQIAVISDNTHYKWLGLQNISQSAVKQ